MSVGLLGEVGNCQPEGISARNGEVAPSGYAQIKVCNVESIVRA